MTQDELKARLLLMGFTTGNIRTYWRRYTPSKVISVIIPLGTYGVTVLYRAPANNPVITKELKCSPQDAFNYIKKKLL